MQEGRGNCLKHLKMGRYRTEGRGHKDFEKEERNLGQGVGALKRGGDWNPLTNYDKDRVHKVLIF